MLQTENRKPHTLMNLGDFFNSSYLLIFTITIIIVILIILINVIIVIC